MVSEVPEALEISEASEVWGPEVLETEVIEPHKSRAVLSQLLIAFSIISILNVYV